MSHELVTFCLPANGSPAAHWGIPTFTSNTCLNRVTERAEKSKKHEQLNVVINQLQNPRRRRRKQRPNLNWDVSLSDLSTRCQADNVQQIVEDLELLRSRHCVNSQTLNPHRLESSVSRSSKSSDFGSFPEKSRQFKGSFDFYRWMPSVNSAHVLR